MPEKSIESKIKGYIKNLPLGILPVKTFSNVIVRKNFFDNF